MACIFDGLFFRRSIYFWRSIFLGDTADTHPAVLTTLQAGDAARPGDGREAGGLGQPGRRPGRDRPEEARPPVRHRRPSQGDAARQRHPGKSAIFKLN